jgi:hypothetical protein
MGGRLPWAPGRREEATRVERMIRGQAVSDDPQCQLAGVDIFADLSERVLTTAVITAAPNVGELVPLGQRRFDSWAEALDETFVCVTSREEVGPGTITVVDRTRLADESRRS